jgi:hypothetical protein
MSKSHNGCPHVVSHLAGGTYDGHLTTVLDIQLLSVELMDVQGVLDGCPIAPLGRPFGRLPWEEHFGHSINPFLDIQGLPGYTEWMSN